MLLLPLKGGGSFLLLPLKGGGSFLLLPLKGGGWEGVNAAVKHIAAPFWAVAAGPPPRPSPFQGEGGAVRRGWTLSLPPMATCDSPRGFKKLMTGAGRAVTAA